jgi:hypothetical protein
VLGSDGILGKLKDGILGKLKGCQQDQRGLRSGGVLKAE